VATESCRDCELHKLLYLCYTVIAHLAEVHGRLTRLLANDDPLFQDLWIICGLQLIEKLRMRTDFTSKNISLLSDPSMNYC